MNATILVVSTKSLEVTTSTGYIIGAVIALFIFGYLIYSLIYPEKF
jgi:K+-transporting ATPase KdpF subunit